MEFPAGLGPLNRARRPFQAKRVTSERASPLTSEHLRKLLQRARSQWVGIAQQLELPDAKEGKRPRRAEPVKLDDPSIDWWTDVEDRLSTPAIREYVKLIRVATDAHGRLDSFLNDLDARLSKRWTNADGRSGADRADDYPPFEMLSALTEVLTAFAPIVASRRPTLTAAFERAFGRSVTGKAVRLKQLRSDKYLSKAAERKKDQTLARQLQNQNPDLQGNASAAAREVARKRGKELKSKDGKQYADRLRRSLGPKKKGR